MGQKVNPVGMGVAVSKEWRSRWFSDKKSFGSLLAEDLEIRKCVKKRLETAGVAKVTIERYANRVRVSIATARPGIVIGRKDRRIAGGGIVAGHVRSVERTHLTTAGAGVDKDLNSDCVLTHSQNEQGD